MRPAEHNLIVVKQTGYLVCETPFSGLQSWITPNNLFFMLRRFGCPEIETSDWRLTVEGEVTRSLYLTYDDLKKLPSKKLAVTMECAGNGRALFNPPCEQHGLPQWRHGGVGNAEWTGVPLKTVLDLAGLKSTVVEVVLEGADEGVDDPNKGVIPFARSLPLEKAYHPDTLLAYEMNGAPLPSEHGFPVRAIVPEWYGMASVKWISRIKVLDHSFDGYFQMEEYIIERKRGVTERQVSRMRVKSLITHPTSGDVITRGVYRIAGLAWAGEAGLASVKVSTNGGGGWHDARLIGPTVLYAWRQWTFDWEVSVSGGYSLLARATDELGNTQPTKAYMNRFGFENNAMQTVNVEVS